MPLKNISSKNNLSLDNVCYLISETFTQDDIGQEIPTTQELMRWCAELPITSNERSNAGLDGIKSELSLMVESEGYDNEVLVKYNNAKYAIYRTYPRSDGVTELYLAKKAGV